MLRNSARWIALFAIAFLSASAAVAQKASLTLSCFPAISVADGRSPVTVTAEVRDLNGSFVRDGTPVVFESDKGTFRAKNVVQTQNGFARAILIAPGIAGTAKVRANVFSLNASASLDIDFVNDRSMLDSAKEYVEVTSNESVVYDTQDRILDATGKDKGVSLRYRDITVKADQIQLRATTYELRARGAHVTIGKFTGDFREFAIKLNLHKGFGLVTTEKKIPVVVRAGMGAAVILQDSTSLEAYDVSLSGITPHVGEINLSPLTFTDTSSALSTVEAKRAVVFPSRGVQFQKANVRVGGQSVMSLPLFQVDLNTSSPIITEQFVDVSNSALSVNYPYYLSLKPGETSLLRFRYGNRYSSGLGATGGTYLDYEYNWNRGAKMEGGLAVTGLARDDWGLGLRQIWTPDPSSSVTAQIDLPAHKSLFSNFGWSKHYSGFQSTVTAQQGRNLDGPRFQSDLVSLNLDTDPIPMGKTPFNLSMGLTAQQRRITGDASESQAGEGLMARIDSKTLFLDPRDTLTVSYTATHWAGSDITSPFTQDATINLASNWAQGLYLQTSYEYAQDGFSEDVLGRHRLMLDGLYNLGRANFRAFVSKSLDLDRLTLNLGLDYKVSPLWRVSTGYWLDRYSGDDFLEQTLVLGYRLGYREIGLSYSTRTNRIGFELLGTRFD